LQRLTENEKIRIVFNETNDNSLKKSILRRFKQLIGETNIFQ